MSGGSWQSVGEIKVVIDFNPYCVWNVGKQSVFYYLNSQILHIASSEVGTILNFRLCLIFT